MRPDREATPFEQTIADHYNSLPPVEQHRLDTKLKQVQAANVASPQAIYYLFPGLGKPLKVKEQK